MTLSFSPKNKITCDFAAPGFIRFFAKVSAVDPGLAAYFAKEFQIIRKLSYSKFVRDYLPQPQSQTPDEKTCLYKLNLVFNKRTYPVDISLDRSTNELTPLGVLL